MKLITTIITELSISTNIWCVISGKIKLKKNAHTEWYNTYRRCVAWQFACWAIEAHCNVHFFSLFVLLLLLLLFAFSLTLWVCNKIYTIRMNVTCFHILKTYFPFWYTNGSNAQRPKIYSVSSQTYLTFIQNIHRKGKQNKQCVHCTFNSKRIENQQKN